MPLGWAEEADRIQSLLSEEGQESGQRSGVKGSVTG